MPGFMRLPMDTVGWLKATNSFYNLHRSRRFVPQHGISENAYTAVVGAIDEWTGPIWTPGPERRAKTFNTLFRTGVCQNRRSNADGLDVADLTFEELENSPSTYGGMSGGGIWSIINAQNGKGEYVDSQILVGVAFYESSIKAGHRSIHFHGAYSIYTKLLSEICERWPSETNADRAVG